MIKGITPSLAEGGKIKIGGLGAERTSKAGNKFRMPEKYDHFVITKTTRDDKGDLDVDRALMDALTKDKDGHIRAIPIVVHSDNLDEVFPTSYAMYNGKQLLCRGDGEKAKRADGTEVKCTCAYLDAERQPICKPHGTLHCSIVAPGQAVAGAVHKWRTTSIISIQRLYGSFSQILATLGTMRGVPLWLNLQPVQVATGTVYCCHVELREADVMNVQRRALEAIQMRKALGTGDIDAAYRAMITAPGDDHETDEERAEIAAEFHRIHEAEVEPVEADPTTERLKALASIDDLKREWEALPKEERMRIGSAGLASIKEAIANRATEAEAV
jgi:hypothetical protein